MSRLLAVLVILAALGIGGWALLRPGPPAVVVSDAVVMPAAGRQTATVHLSLDNQGAPLVLSGVSGPEGTNAHFMGATGPLVLPGGDSASLAADGAHIMLGRFDPDLGEGALLPLSLTTGDGRAIAIRARVAGAASDAMAMHGMGDAQEVAGDTVPELSLSVGEDGAGWRLNLTLAGLTMAEVPDGTPHAPGEGHAHLYLNGLKLGRLYTPEARIGALPPGRHTVTVTLNTHDHRPYTTGGTPIRAEAVIEAR